ncbi:hypothetical protein J4206_02530 [Candidatus Woesearchaeota archaeon]|nr:hypothetical protein [Candidatus Woesearchaeota archaeon]
MSKETQKKHAYYAGLSEPIEVRKTILEASREVLQSLQQFDKFSAVRREKKQAIADLKSNVSEINRLFSELKSHLPNAAHTHLIKTAPQKHEPKVSATIPVTKQKSKKQKEPSVKLKPKELSELEKLEKELGEIENKLGSMT